MSWIALGVAGGSALLKVGEGAIQNSKANSIDSKNPYPTESVQGEYQQNVNQAQQMAQQGIAAPAYNNQLNSISRNQAGGLASLSNSANPGGNIASIVRAGDDATSKLNAQDAVARNNNMLNLLKERTALAQQKDKAWDWNYQQKYLSNLAKSNALRGSGNSNINSGLNEVGSTAMSGAKLGAFGSNGGGGVGNFGYGNNAGYQPGNPLLNQGVQVTDQDAVSGWGGSV